MKKIFTIMLAVLGLTACSSQKKSDTENTESSKVLVLYYSQNGATKSVAEELQSQLGADIEAIDIENPYDGDFQQTIARCQQEMTSGELPVVKPLSSDLSQYDVIFLGFPVWFGTYASPIKGLLKDITFEGKTVVPFCTFGSGGIEACTKDLAEALPLAQVVAGYGVRTARVAKISDEINRFLIEGGFKDGEVTALPAFMEHHPVSEAEADIFNQACGDYQMPLGSPVDVAVRETESSTDYEFTAVLPGQNGEESTSTIYVSVEKAEGATPEFTKVVR